MDQRKLIVEIEHGTRRRQTPRTERVGSVVERKDCVAVAF